MRAPVLRRWDIRAWSVIERLRHGIGPRITAVLPGQTGAIANALITGARGGISEATNSAFRDSGLMHILAISGLHMAIMAGSVFYLVRLLLAAMPALALLYPIKKWAAVAAMLGALAYLLISGSSFATVRSAIMISIMFIAVLLDRPALALRNVVLAALLILIAFPESLFDVGFQMSFAAVLALICVYEEARKSRVWSLLPERPSAWLLLFVGGIIATTLIASTAVAPFAAYHFHKSQQYAVLANLIAIPICNFIVMPAALASLLAMPLGLEAAPLRVMGWGIDGMLWTAERVASLPGAVLHIPAMPTPAFLAIIGGGLWLALWQTRWRVLGAGGHRGRHRARADAAASRPPHRPRRRPHRRARARRPAGGSGLRTRLRAATLARIRRRRQTPAGGGQECRLHVRRGRVPGRGQGADGGGRAPPRRVRRRLPARLYPRLGDREPARLHAAEGRRRFLCRPPRRHARNLHRGGRKGAHRDGGRGARGEPWSAPTDTPVALPERPQGKATIRPQASSKQIREDQ